MFDVNNINTLRFGEFIKTYIIPSKYNSLDPYISINNEYFLMFYVPPTAQVSALDPMVYSTFENFMKKFDSSYDILNNNLNHSYILFKINNVGELVYIGNYTVMVNSSDIITTSLVLSLFTSNQLILDSYNNVIGIKFPVCYGYYSISSYKFEAVNFTINFYKVVSSNDTVLMNYVNRISPYYSLGASQLSLKNNITYSTYTNTTKFVDFGYGIPLYYTANEIVFNLKKIYIPATFQVMLPNSKNLEQMIIIYKECNQVYLDFFNANDPVITKNITVDQLTVEQVKDNLFNLVRPKVGSNNSLSCYTGEFDQENLNFFNIIPNTDFLTSTITNSSTYPEITVFNTNAYQHFKNFYKTSRIYNKADFNNTSDLIGITDAGLYNLTRSFSLDSILKEVPLGTFIYTTNNIKQLYMYGNTYQKSSYNHLSINNISPMFYEIGNQKIYPNHNIIYPNDKDVLKSTVITDGFESNTNYLYDTTNNIKSVKIINNSPINDYQVTGNIIKSYQLDSTTSVYSFKNVLTIEDNLIEDIISSGDLEIFEMGTINNFLNYSLLQNNCIDNKSYIISKIIGECEVDRVNEFSFYIQYNDFIDFIDFGKFIKFNGIQDYYMSIGGRIITDINSFITDPYIFIKETFEYNNIDLSLLPNNNNNFIQNISLSQNTIPKTLYGIVVDGDDSYVLGAFPYKKMEQVINFKPIITENVSTYEIDHFKDADGTIYNKLTIDYIVLNVNFSNTDISLKLSFLPNIIYRIGDTFYNSIEYAILPFSETIINYMPPTQYLDLTTLVYSDVNNITPTLMDSTTIFLSSSNSIDHLIEISLNNIILNENREISFLVEVDSTGEIINNFGVNNIFDNVLFNDNISINNNLMSYYDQISQDFEFQNNYELLPKRFDINLFGQFSRKCINNIQLKYYPDIRFIGLNSNHFQADTYNLNTYKDTIDSTSISMPILAYVTESVITSLSWNYNTYDTLNNSYSIDIIKNRLSVSESTEGFQNNVVKAITYLTNISLDSAIFSSYEKIVTFASNLSQSTKMLFPFQKDFYFGLCNTVSSLSDIKQMYLGVGSPSSAVYKSYFYGIKLEDLPIFNYDYNQNSDFHEIVLILNADKKGDKQLKLSIDNTSYDDQIITLISNPIATLELPIASNVYYYGMAGFNKDYLMQFNYELSTEELEQIKNNNNKILLNSTISQEFYKTKNNYLPLANKPYKAFPNINRKFLNITFKNIDEKICIYVNDYLQKSVSANNIFKYIRLYGNSQFGNKYLKILKTDSYIHSDLIQNYL